MEDKLPQRMCIICRKMQEKNQLFRFSQTKDKSIILDLSMKKDGRGAYVCKNPECVKKCVKTRQLNRAFKCEVKKELYEELVKELESAKKQN